MVDIVGLKVNDKDNVAVVFTEGVKAGHNLNVRNTRGEVETVTLLSDVPYGHKVAIREIKKGTEVLKYGEALGISSSDIKIGDHVHVHNMDSQRGRGDLSK